MKRSTTRFTRRGGTIVFVSVCLTALFSMAALAIDLGTLYIARAELQTASDSGSLSGATLLLDENRLKGGSAMDAVIADARAGAVATAGRNPVLNHYPTIDSNSGNSPSGDVVVGYLADPDDPNCQLSFSDPLKFNSVQVRVRRDSERNGLIFTKFAKMFGVESMHSGARATATFRDGVVGYHVTGRSGNAKLLPFALHENVWNQLMAGQITADSYTYDAQTGEVSNGADGIREINLYPGSGTGQLPPGNFGTVDIGSPNNSTADITRQILYGVNAEDLSYFGGELRLGSDGTLSLNGDTGLSAAVKDDLEAIKGQPRAIPIFRTVSGNGNNSHFTVTGFVGIRIVHVKLTGAMRDKQVIIQPAVVVDDSAVTESGGNSYYVFRPVELTR